MSASPELARTPKGFSPRHLATTTALRPIEGGHSKPAPMSEEGAQGEVEYDEEAAAGCRTPTSEESKLPSVAAVCPPAPRKREPARAVRCKRKLWAAAEAELIAVGAEEMEQLFEWRVQWAPRRTKKRRCDQAVTMRN